MVDFRKAFLLLAVLALVVSLPVAADTGMTCAFSNGSIPPLRAEGLAEEVGQVLITCTGGTSTPRGAVLPTINVQIYLNTYITSKLLSSGSTASEALLLLDNPVSRNGQSVSDPTGYQTVSSTIPNTTYPVAYGDGGYRGGSTVPVTLGGSTVSNAERPNVFVGQQLSSSSITWLNIPFDAPGTNGNRVIRLVNVRANAYNNALTSSSVYIPTSISMFISISGTGAPALSSAQLTVGLVQQGMSFSSNTYTGYLNNSSTTWVSSLTSASSFKQCVPPAGKYYSGTAGTYYLLTLNFAEQFGTAFRNNPGTRQDSPTGYYNTESMFYNPDFKAGVGGGALAGMTLEAGLATQPTQLIAKFYNVPDNVSLYVPQTTFTGINTDGTTATADVFTLVSSSGVNSDSSVALSGGTGTLTIQASQTTEGAMSTIKVPVYVYYSSSTLPSTGSVTVTGNYAPTSTATTATYGASVPRFVSSPSSASSFSIIYCKTNLLFPWVTNYAGWDTGIAISNTSADPFGTVAQKGTCYLYYYGTTNVTGAAPAMQTSTEIASGGQLVFTVSGGSADQNIVGTPGFQGYIIATCNFQYAHGYAFVSDQGSSKVAEGYLGLVLDQNMFSSTTRTKAQSEINAH